MIGILCLLALVSPAFGVISPLVNGNGTKKAGLDDAPWIVSLQMFEYDFAFCGATLIFGKENGTRENDTISVCSGLIATAKSCVEGIPEDINVKASLRNYNLANTSADYARIPLKFDGEPIFNKTEDELFGDMALRFVEFELLKPEDDSDPCPLPAIAYRPFHNDLNETFLASMNATIFGWGLTQENGPLQKELLLAPLPLYTDRQCGTDLGMDQFNPQTMVCAGDAAYQAYSHDTGGPMTCAYEINEIKYEYLCGIASFKPKTIPPLQKKRTVFTDVPNFADWISKVILAKHPEPPPTTTEKPPSDSM